MKTPTPTQNEQPTITVATMLNKAEVAKQLGVAVRTLDSLVAAKEFPPGARVGRHLYWTEVAIRAWHQRVFAAQLAWQP